MKKQFDFECNQLIFYEIITRFAIFERVSEKLADKHLQNEIKCVNF